MSYYYISYPPLSDSPCLLDRNNPVVEDSEFFNFNGGDEDDYEDDDDIMAPPAVSAPKQATKKKKSSNAPVKAKAPPPVLESYSLFSGDSYEKTRYVENNVAYVEVEIFVNGCLPNHAYQAYLDSDKKILFWKRGTPKAVFAPDRLGQLMSPGTFNPNHTRVVAHGDTHQEILAANPETAQGWYFSNLAQSIDLGCTVIGEPRVTYSYYPVCQIDGGQTQHNTIYSFVYEVASRRIHEKKKATKTAILTLALDDNEDDDGPRIPVFAAAAHGTVAVAQQQQPRGRRQQAPRTMTAHAFTNSTMMMPRNKLTNKRLANESSSSSSSDDDDDDSEDDDDVKPPAAGAKVKAEVKAEPKTGRGKTATKAPGACIVLDDADY